MEDVKNHTYAWNERKQQFTLRQIGIAVEALSQKGWVNDSWNEEAHEKCCPPCVRMVVSF